MNYFASRANRAVKPQERLRAITEGIPPAHGRGFERVCRASTVRLQKLHRAAAVEARSSAADARKAATAAEHSAVDARKFAGDTH